MCSLNSIVKVEILLIAFSQLSFYLHIFSYSNTHQDNVHMKSLAGYFAHFFFMYSSLAIKCWNN